MDNFLFQYQNDLNVINIMETQMEFYEIIAQHDIGEMFIDFLSADLSVYEKRREEIENLTEILSDKGIDSFTDINDKNVHEINQIIIDTIPWIDNQCKKYLPYEPRASEKEFINHYLHKYFIGDTDIIYMKILPPRYEYKKQDFCYDGIFGFKCLQRDLEEAAYLCLDEDSLDSQNACSSAERYSEYAHEFACMNFTEMNAFIKLSFSIHDGDKTIITNNYAPKDQITLVRGYSFKTTEEALTCELYRMLERNIRIRKCAMCKKYFILKNKHNALCCSRIYRNTKHTCQKAFADKKQREKIQNHPILREYSKINKRMNARKRNALITPKEYADWARAYSDLRNNYMQNYESATTEKEQQFLLAEFKKILERSSKELGK